MVATEHHVLPTEEELTVQEINLTYPTLQAAAFHLGKYCEHKNNEFLLCRYEEKDIRKCLNEGKEVTACALEFFQMIKKTCRAEFDQYARCIDRSSGKSNFGPCRKTQAVFDKCVLDNFNIERPSFGYFCEAKIHDTKRPKPKQEIVVYPEVPSLPKDTVLEPPAHGSRRIWTW